jgi:DNA-binding transcriptional ArsR family regulator
MRRVPPGQRTTLFDLLGACRCPLRLELLVALGRRSLEVSELIDRTELQPSLVSTHLGRLSTVGLVQSATEGHHRRYSLTPSARMTRDGVGWMLTLAAGDGATLALRITPAFARELGIDDDPTPGPIPAPNRRPVRPGPVTDAHGPRA